MTNFKQDPLEDVRQEQLQQMRFANRMAVAEDEARSFINEADIIRNEFKAVDPEDGIEKQMVGFNIKGDPDGVAISRAELNQNPHMEDLCIQQLLVDRGYIKGDQ